MLPIRAIAVELCWRAFVRLTVATGLACAISSAGQTPPATGRMTHHPQVLRASDGPASELRAAIEASAQRYTEIYRTADFGSALAEARRGLALATQAGSPRDEIEFLKAALYSSWLLGDTESGLDFGQRLIARGTAQADERGLSFAHRVLGTVFGQLGQSAPQREHTRLALACAERAGDDLLRIAALNNLGNHALADGDLATARRIHEDILAYRERHDQRWDAAGTLTNLADVAEKARDLPRALELQERALAIRIELKDRRGQAHSRWQVASLLRQLGRHDEALAHLTEARILAEASGGQELLRQVFSVLAQTQEARGDFAAALAAERLAAGAAAALASERARLRAVDVAARLELVQKQQTIADIARDRRVKAAELRARTADLMASELALARSDALRVSVGTGVLALAVALAAIIVLQRTRLRAERRILAETQAARAAAEEADRVKTRFLGVASHDIRAPLGNIAMLADSLRQPPTDAADHRERVGLIGAETQRVLSLVEDLVTVAALETGKLELRPAPLDLWEVVLAATGSLRWQAEAKRQRLVLEPASSGHAVLTGDAARLHQVVTNLVANLVANALKFSPPDTAITVALARTASHVALSVRDHGPGLSEADIAQLFTPFQRLAAQPGAGATSHGLGLSIVHEIVRLHGGTIRVESTLGAGATFLVELPAS